MNRKDPLVESIAQELYEAFHAHNTAGYRPWEPGGNSDMQDAARRTAITAIERAAVASANERLDSPGPKTRYVPPERLVAQLDRSFRYHPPKGDQPERYVAIRDKAAELARLIADLTPESREQSLALTKLEEAVMWANAGLARNE